MRRTTAVCMTTLAMTAPSWADVRLPAIIGNNMVIQQGEPVPVWGWAEPGEKVSVAIGDNKADAVADAAGKWSCRLTAMRPSDQPVEMMVTGKNALTVKNILVGEVWLCAGQSNMGLTLSNATDGAEEAKKADYPSIRLFVIRTPREAEPRDDFLGHPGSKVPGGQWMVCNPKNTAQFSAVAYFFGRKLLGDLKRPVGLVEEGWGSTAIEGWTPLATFKTDPDLADYPAKIAAYENQYPGLKADFDKKLADWQAASEKDRAKYPPVPPIRPELTYGGIYNAIVSPLRWTPMAGVIWYQGEQNVGDAAGYGRMFPAMIRAWRKNFRREDLPFLFVQLPNINVPTSDPNRPSSIAELRHAQSAALALPRTAMVVAIDVGEANNVHPPNKLPVSERLERAALAMVYKQDIANAFCPVFDSMKVEGPKLIVNFKHAEGGLVVKGDKLAGFAIAGAGGKYFWANAVVEGESVVLTCEKVPVPLSVRYGWANNPELNLFNKAGLPAAPFYSGESPAPPRARTDR